MASSTDVKPLQDKVAIVTGVSSPVGIGAAVARRLAGSGARLVLAADAPPDPIAQECAALLGDPKAVVPLTADLGDASAVAAMVAEAEKRFGRIDMLVNNAAVRVNRAFGDFTLAEFDTAVAVNLRAPFLASQGVLPSMRRQGGGRIVHIASQLGSVAYQTRTIYGMTKAALIHLTKSMALELAPHNIQVNAVSPGPIATQPTLDRVQHDPEEAARRLEYVPMGRYGRPEEIGEVVHWLLTTDASFLTGHDLIVDGGYTIH
ncbi:oxidoreductase [Reyranella soli]|jgi:NAD(P)-dependent dehydrogenase (short-subunit alcohol dehydrogenase family)|uniref:Oxidoreductase n=1 Tax=Reyranella soli TaxID=1230389 RepID=A0A512NDI4_9HYPH|nr:oxidoreductase [Reyranella soli]